MSAFVPADGNRALLPALTAERPVAWPKRRFRTMANGLEIVLAESHTFPKVSAHLFFRTGNGAVADRAPGLADLAAGVVRTGTASRTSRQIEEHLRRMGADLGTRVGADSSSIAISGLAEFSAGLLELVADLARNASFPENEFERERRQHIEGLKIERTTPGFLASERFRRVLFGQHPYAVLAPTEEQVASYRREQLQDFYRRNYTPANALLIAVGDFSTESLLADIERIFGDWRGPEPEPQFVPSPPKRTSRQVYLVHLPGSVQTQVLIGNLAITRHDPDWYRLVLANSIFGGAFHSRLIVNVREQKGYTYDARSSVTPLRQHGFFSVHAAVRNDVVAASLTEILYEMDRIRSVPVTADELESARSYLAGVFSLGIATQDGLSTQLSTQYLDRLPEDYLETYRERIRALTAADVLLAARRHFDSANAQIVLVGDREQIFEQGALFGHMDVLDAHGHPIQTVVPSQ
jgi:zinc protease